jgi:hypothetical protein
MGKINHREGPIYNGLCFVSDIAGDATSHEIKHLYIRGNN